jgi:two-component system sensor histidine kinase NblS
VASEPGVGTTFWFDLPLESSDLDELALQVERRGSDQPALAASRAA